MATPDNLPVMKIVKPQGMRLLPPAPGKCHLCACDHAPDWPHNHQSVYYAVRFSMIHNRSPRWADAMAHCEPAMQQAWISELAKRGYWTEADAVAAVNGDVIAEPTTYAS